MQTEVQQFFEGGANGSEEVQTAYQKTISMITHEKKNPLTIEDTQLNSSWWL
jgi:hypothetical protein